MRIVIAALSVLIGCASGTPGSPSALTARSVHFAKAPGPHIQIEKVSEHVWLHESSHVVEGWGRVSANGIIVVGTRGALVIDSSWTEKQTRWLLERVRQATGRPAIALVPTHSHNDRAGGLGAAAQLGVATHAFAKTNEILRRQGKPAAGSTFGVSRSFDLGGVTAEVFYPGPGHTVDNVVVYVGRDRLLFGGCLIRSNGSRRLGNTKEADVTAWPSTVNAVIKRYPDTQRVIPGHGPRGGPELLTHTVELAKKGR